MRHLLLVFVAFLLYPLSALPQAADSDVVGVLDWLTEHDITVRESFSGTVRDAGAPASFTYFHTENTDDFYAIDLAIRAREFGGWDQGLWQGRFYPVIEYHRNTTKSAPLNKTEVNLGAEIERSIASCPVDGTQDEAPFCRSLLMDFRIKRTSDSENHDATQSASVLFAPFSVSRGWPGSDITTTNGQSIFYWLPSFGIEVFESLAVTRTTDEESVATASPIDVTFAVTRLNLEYRPFADRFAGRLALVVNYANYALMGSSTILENRNSIVTMSLDYYLDANKRVAIGFKYSNGASPAHNFLDQQTLSLGLSLKISPE